MLTTVTGISTTARSGTLPFSAYTLRVTWTGQRLKQARARKGLTQRQLHELLGASLRSVASWERGESKPQAHWAVKLDDLFAEPATAGEEPRPTAIDEETLRGIDDLALIAELARRLVEHRGVSTPGSAETAAQRFVWYERDAPTARQLKADAHNPTEQDKSGENQV